MKRRRWKRRKKKKNKRRRWKRRKKQNKNEENVEEILATNMAEEGKGDSDENAVDVMGIVMELNGELNGDE
ncbi:hypothetical protein KY290_015661 [Solanum tuberosum]|uniref:Uncharacterized protein n=1 Tax=Solanum tuberosum TaxID=4113 RepID=A0ABQ7VTS6_SOLTU|nr:hypothetical protein KY289_015229 [Solanum tuberosum]KAH0700773.1 hypothetical protein KY284_014988 [Solanum tuberosum]KAH0717518.1 hypothetical protein KY285_013549 [Solanum tuberosum]KAH0771680.1 hypothetical protein KY290_015661 [Solanum tuberosum]